jgi:hypothetical protein
MSREKKVAWFRVSGTGCGGDTTLAGDAYLGLSPTSIWNWRGELTGRILLARLADSISGK